MSGRNLTNLGHLDETNDFSREVGKTKYMRLKHFMSFCQS